MAGIWLGDAGEAADSRAVAGGVADLPTALDQLLEACGDQRRAVDGVLRARIARGKDGLREHIRAGLRHDYGQTRPMHYGLALDALPDVVDADTIVLGDIGSHNQWTRLVLQTLIRTTFVPEGYWGAMGFGLPAALAAKLAYPQKKVLAVTGDGCFLMASADFSTAVEARINPVILILNDRQYGMIVGMQEGTYGRATQTALDGPDFVAFARSFGADGVRIDAPDELPAAIERGLASPTIFVIVATCDYRFPPYDLARSAAELG